MEGVEGRVIRGGKRKEEVGEEGELSRGEIKKGFEDDEERKSSGVTRNAGGDMEVCSRGDRGVGVEVL